MRLNAKRHNASDGLSLEIFLRREETDIKRLLSSPWNLIAGHLPCIGTRDDITRVDFTVRRTREQQSPLRNGSSTDGGKAVHARAILARWTKCRREKSGLSVDPLPSPERKSLRRSTFFKYPPGTCSQEKRSEEFLSRLPAARVVIYWC